MKTLLEAGAASQAELEQAQTALSTSEAQLKAAEAQIREQRVALAYHRVTAPTAGVVGDIPVRVGDSVTTLHRAHHHRPERGPRGLHQRARPGSAEPEGRPARAPRGRPAAQVVSTETVSFVAPSVDGATQSVLAKAALDDGGLLPDRAVRPRADRLDGGAGPDRAPGGAQPHQRPVLRLRGRAAARAARPSPTSARWSRARWSATTTS